MKKPDQSAHMRIMVRLAFCVAEPHQAAAMSALRWQSRARALMCLSKGSVWRDLLLFLLTGLLLCLLRFLGHRALRDPKIELNASRTSTCIKIEYTTIAKLILRASKKVNGGHTVASARRSLAMRGRAHRVPPQGPYPGCGLDLSRPS
jgi:hypothetical protein